MHHNLIIKDGDTTKVVKEVLVDGIQFVDEKPRAGSTNPVTSEGVKTAIDGAVGDASEALQEQIDDIAEKAGSGYIPKGEASVATLNGLSGHDNGELYTMTDAGTLTEGSLAVVAGDTVAWDATNEVWYKAMDYAPRQYGTNEVHNLPTTITAFRSGDYIAVDGTNTAKMSKDDLLQITSKPRIKKTPINLNDQSMWHSGGIGSGDGRPSANPNRIYCDLTAFDLESVLSFTTTIFGLTKTLYAYKADGTYLGYSPSVDILVVLNTYPTAKKFRLSMISTSSLAVSAVGDTIVFSSDTIWLNDLLSIEQRIAKDETKINDIDESVNGVRTPVDMNDPSIWNVGNLNVDTGMPEASTSRLYSNKIAFTSDSEWPLVTQGAITNWNQFAYDKDGNFLGWRQWGSTMAAVRTSFPTAAYVRVLLISSSTRNTSDIGSTIIFQSGTTFEKSFDGLEDRMAEAEEDIQNLSSMSDILQNKKWYACGDSFTHGSFEGDTSGYPTIIPSGQYAGQNANYPYLIGNRTGCNVYNIAVNGSTLAQHAGSSSANCFTYPVTGRLYSIPSDADYITLYFGINDGHNGIPVGTSSDNDNSTFWGALNVALGYLVQNFPHARIGVIASNGCDADEYPQAAVDAAKKWGVACLDLDGAVGCRTMIRCRRSPASDAVKTIIFNQQKVSNDNSHPNAMAHAMESTFIEAWLKSL